MSLSEMLQAIPRLSSEERALLADCLAESGDPVQGGEIALLWVAEACRRDEELANGRVQEIPGDEALARVRRRFPG